MSTNYLLDRQHTGLLVVDMQTRLFPRVERCLEMLQAIQKVVQGFRIMNLPIYATEQYPEKLGETLKELKIVLGDNQEYLSKTTFACTADKAINDMLAKTPVKQWIVVGIEAHVCILQTVKGLLSLGKQVVVLNDAISSRSIFDYSTAIAEMRDCGARISSVETVLFELMHDSKAEGFKALSQLIR